MKAKLFIPMLMALFVLSISADTDVDLELKDAYENFIVFHGQEIDLDVEVDAPAYLIVYAVNLRGDVRILFPNYDVPDNYVRYDRVRITSDYHLLADREGPVFIVAVASSDNRLRMRFRDSFTPWWNASWGAYDPHYSFIGYQGFDRENDYQIVLSRKRYVYNQRRLINDFDMDDIMDELDRKINRDYEDFNPVIDTFLDELNRTVDESGIELSSDTLELYVAGSRYNADYYDVRGADNYDDYDYEHEYEGAGSYTGASVDIDFDFHLGGFGSWVYVGGYRVWYPSYGHGWRPYSHGYWRWSTSGWIWISYHPWQFTYYYGYWYYDWYYGWVWLPGYTWHTAHVNWYYGRGYVGWRPAPLPRVYRSLRWIPPRTVGYNGYVFVKSDHFTSNDLSRYIVSKSTYDRVLSQDLQKGAISSIDTAQAFKQTLSKANIPVKSVALEKVSQTIKSKDATRTAKAYVPKLSSNEKQAVEKQRAQTITKLKRTTKTGTAITRDKQGTSSSSAVTRTDSSKRTTSSSSSRIKRQSSPTSRSKSSDSSSSSVTRQPTTRSKSGGTTSTVTRTPSSKTRSQSSGSSSSSSRIKRQSTPTSSKSSGNSSAVTRSSSSKQRSQTSTSSSTSRVKRQSTQTGRSKSGSSASSVKRRSTTAARAVVNHPPPR